jgi:hypothetical protein
VSWVVTSLAGVLVGSLTVGRAIGSWKASLDARIAAEAKARETGLAAERQERDARVATEAQAREAAIEAERTGRLRLHRDVDEIRARLLDGDKRFDALIRTEGAVKALTAELQATQRIIGERLVTRPEYNADRAGQKALCEEKHRRIPHA